MAGLFPKIDKVLPPKHRDKMASLMRAYADQDYSLSALVSRKILGRKIGTLKRYCDDYAIIFKDWTPMRMRPKKDKRPKAKKSRRKKGTASNEHADKDKSP